MNFKGYKKISSDKHSTKLMHPKGHSITIIHSGISESERQQLEHLMTHKMAEGGKVEDYGQIPMKESRMGGAPADSGVEDKAPYVQPHVPNQDPNYSGVVVPMAKGGKVPMYAEGTPPGGVSADDSPDNGVSSVSSGRDAEASPDIPVPTPDPTFSVPKSFPGDPYASANALTMKGLQEQQQGNQMNASVAGQQGGMNSFQYQAAGDQLNSANNLINANLQKYQKDRQALYQDWAQGHIDPNHYINSLSTGDKINTGIGLLLGGIGAGKTGQPNLAYNHLTDQINRDVSAQQQNFNNKGTLYAANLRETQNAKDAYDLTVSQQKDLLAMHLQQIGNAMAQPTAQAAALTASGKLKQEAGALLGPIAQRQAMMQSMQSGQSSGAQQIRAGQVMGYIPEGQANDLYKQLQTADNMGKSKDAVLSAFDQVSAQQNPMNRITNPIQSNSQIDALWDPSIAQLTKDSDGRITPTDLPMMNSLKPGLTDDPNTRAVKRAKLDQFINQKMSFPMLDAYNVKAGSGNYKKPTAPPPSSNMVSVISPSGERFKLPAANLQKALSRGYKAVQ